MIPKIAIIGRPNVGKSTLFNRLIKEKKSIVEDRPGVTRDRIYGKVYREESEFTIIDTGGYDTNDNIDTIISVVRKQIFNAIDEADALIFLLDGKSGLSALDLEINEQIRFVEKPIFYVVNKIDGETQKDNLYDFYKLGVDKLYAISAEHNRGLPELLDDLIEALPKEVEVKEAEEIIKVAIIGRPNVGKSSIINKLLNEDRVVVDNKPGTTRDSVDTLLIENDKKYLLIDTAGIRGKSKVKEGIEGYSVQASLKSIRRADIVVLVVDTCEEGVVEQDTKIAGYANELGKACLIVVNKWDIIDKEGFLYKDFNNTVYNKLKYLNYAPIISTSVVNNLRVNKILPMVDTIYQEYKKRVPTAGLNALLGKATALHTPPITKGKKINKLYYATQIDKKPPHFVIFTKDPDAIHFSYKRFIINQIREEYGFTGCPLIVDFKRKKTARGTWRLK